MKQLSTPDQGFLTSLTAQALWIYLHKHTVDNFSNATEDLHYNMKQVSQGRRQHSITKILIHELLGILLGEIFWG